MEPTRIRVLIADDERAARQRLEDLLRDRDNIDIVDQVRNGREAISAIRDQRPDLVFLDVQMPGLSGIEVVGEIGPTHMPAVVFVTAYDEYAVKAFDMAALDYLLKPFDDERFEQALDRVREAVSAQELETLRSRLEALLHDASPDADAKASTASRYVERIAVDMRGQKRIVPVDRIDCITASGSYAELHVGDTTYVIRERMQTLEDHLDPSQFYRIHRSTIVQLDRIDVLRYGEGGAYTVRLTDGRELKVSRSRYEELQQQLGIDAL